LILVPCSLNPGKVSEFVKVRIPYSKTASHPSQGPPTNFWGLEQDDIRRARNTEIIILVII
jgi:hypothetical protein